MQIFLIVLITVLAAATAIVLTIQTDEQMRREEAAFAEQRGFEVIVKEKKE